VEAGWRTEESIDCDNCKFVIPLLPANEQFIDLIELTGPTLFNDQGGVNYGAVESGIKALQIPSERYFNTIAKINTYAKILREHREIKEQHGRPNPHRTHHRR
jgi:hypothetical protein